MYYNTSKVVGRVPLSSSGSYLMYTNCKKLVILIHLGTNMFKHMLKSACPLKFHAVYVQESTFPRNDLVNQSL